MAFGLEVNRVFVCFKQVVSPVSCCGSLKNGQTNEKRWKVTTSYSLPLTVRSSSEIGTFRCCLSESFEVKMEKYADCRRNGAATMWVDRVRWCSEMSNVSVLTSAWLFVRVRES